jgi:hypothetical protein
MTKYLGPPPKWRETDANGDPLVGGKIWTYASGTTTPLATYADADGVTPNTNPVILNASGEADINFSDVLYKIVCMDSADVTQYTIDPYDPKP